MTNTDFTYKADLKIVLHIDVFSKTVFFGTNLIKMSNQLFSFFFNFLLLQKMDNRVINKRSEIEEIIEILKPHLELKTNEINERRLKIFKKCIERNEKIVKNKDETDIEYINDELDTIKRVFKGFCGMYNIDYTPKTIDDSTFIETPDQIKNKKCTINQQNKDNKCFQYSVSQPIFITKKLNVIQKEFQRLNPILTTLIGKTLIFHHKNNILKH